MIHEATHACRLAEGSKTLYDHTYAINLGTPGCYADRDVAPFEETDRQCGDPP